MLIFSWVITFVVIVGLGILAGSKIKNSSQWSGGDKTLDAWGVGSILAAWQIGGLSIIGAAQNGYTIGIAGAWYSLAGCLYLLVVGLLAKAIRKNMPGDSVPVFLKSRYSAKSSKLYSYIWVCLGLFYVPIQLLTISTVIRIVFPGLAGSLATVIGLAVAAIYAGFAGMRGASIIGKIVCFGIYIALIIFTAAVLPQFGGIAGMRGMLTPEFFSMGNMPTQKVIGWAIGGILVASVMQSVLQPILAAKDTKSARNGAFIGYILAAPICIITALIGMMALASGTDLGNGATAFAHMIGSYSSPLIAGLILGVTTLIIAATMATMMMATGTIITNIYKTQINPGAEDKKILAVSKWGTILFSFLTLIPAFLLPTSSLVNMFLTLLYVASGPVSFSILAGIFWKKASAQGAFYSILSGVITGVLWVMLGLVDTLESIYPIIVVSYLVGYFVSLATYKKELKLAVA